MTDSTPRHSRRDLDRLADGADDASPLGDFVGSLRSMGDGDGVQPSAMLAEFVTSPTSADEILVEAVAPDEETNRMIPQLTALITTTAGKIAIGGSVVAAAVTGIVAVEPATVDDVLITATADSSTTTAGFDTTASTVETSTTNSTTDSTIDETNATSTTVTTQPTSTSGVASGSAESIEVPGVGVVTYVVIESQPVLVSIDVADEWTIIDESTPGEVDLSFRTVDGRRVDVDIEREDGEIRVRVEDKSDGAVSSDDSDSDSDDDSDDRDDDSGDRDDDSDDDDSDDDSDDDLDDDDSDDDLDDDDSDDDPDDD